MTPVGCYHCSIDFQHSSYLNLEVDCCQIFPVFFFAKVARGESHFQFFSCFSDFQSSSSHTSSMVYKSADCAGQDIICWTCCSILRLTYLWPSLLVSFGSLSYIIQILKSQTAFQTVSRDARVWCDCRYDSISPSPGAHPELYNLQKSPHTHPHNDRDSSMLYRLCDTKGHSFTLTLRSTYILLFDQKISNFDSSGKGLHYTDLLFSFLNLKNWVNQRHGRQTKSV